MISASKVMVGLAAAGLTAVSMGTAHALPSYGNIVAPGVYFGSGNVNGNWTIDTSAGIEVALRAKDRTTLATIDGSSGIYHANAGFAVAGGGPKAAWNYELSVNTHGGGGVLDLSSYVVRLQVDTNPSGATTFTTLNVQTNWPDNAWWSGAVRTGAGPAAPGEYGTQQSANPLFGDSGFMPGFNVFQDGIYDLILTVYDGATGLTPLASTHITVVVPEPGSILLLGIGLAGLGFSIRRRKAA